MFASMVMCMCCGEVPNGKTYYCVGHGPDRSQDWFPIQPHAFCFCLECSRLIDAGDREALAQRRGFPDSSAFLRSFTASTGLLGPVAPYATSLAKGAKRVYVEVIETHARFNFRLPGWPDGPFPIWVEDEGSLCTVTFTDGSNLHFNLDQEYARWVEEHPPVKWARGP
jgi:hypothetical protein